ncbi:MAG: hypothetical protein FJ317_08955 [SAR202 cluster bacterium]|nr:hypothetical protein [SAR202 cluster bacterium]
MSKWWLFGTGAFIVVLVIASIVIALTEREAALTPGTPEEAVQRFLRSWEDRDYASAHAMLVSNLQADCPIEQFASQDQYRAFSRNDPRVTLEDTQVFDGTTTVTVRITDFYSNEPFGTSESSYTQSFTLKQDTDGAWRFTQYPYPVYGCPYFGKPDEARPLPTATPTAEPVATPES